MCNHIYIIIYYLNEEIVVISLFDDRINYEIDGEKMSAMTNQDEGSEENEDWSKTKVLLRKDETGIFLENNNNLHDFVKTFSEISSYLKDLKLQKNFSILT